MKKTFLLLVILSMTFSLVLPVIALNPMITQVPEFRFINTDEYLPWCKDAIEWSKREYIMSDTVYSKEETYNDEGWIDHYTSFFGENNITRGEVAVIMSRYNGSYVTFADGCRDSIAPAFVDVPDGQWYTPAAQWAYDNGIVNGVGGAYFAPNRTITREEFAAMLYRYTNYLEVDTSARADFSAFTDGDSVSDWATDAMAWAVGEGLISGKPGNLLAPQDTITRAEVAVIIYRFNNEVKAHRDIWDGSSH